MKVLTMSLPEIESWGGTEKTPYAIVSITSPGDDPALLPDDNPRWMGTLRLQFWDTNSDMEGAFTPEDAKRVAEFVRSLTIRHRGDYLPEALLVIHCVGGISRSTGMAQAVAEWLGVKRLGNEGIPNSRVYKMTLAALRFSDE